MNDKRAMELLKVELSYQNRIGLFAAGIFQVFAKESVTELVNQRD